MLKALQFVRGSVARKDFVPSLTHYSIAQGRIRGFNGTVALCSPIPLDLEVTPRADVFQKAIEACSDVAQLSLTEDKKLLIQSGDFQIFVDCLAEEFPKIYPEGKRIELNGNLLKAVKVLAPFIADDASRKWAMGILFRGPSAFATNNIVIVEYWLGDVFPVEINITKLAVQELLRIGEEPIAIQVAEGSVTFHYEGERWLRAQNSPVTWPDVGAILDQPDVGMVEEIPEGFFKALDKLAPFVGEQGEVFFKGNSLSTVAVDKGGASVKLACPTAGVFHVKQLQLLEELMETAVWRYPAPCLFFGDNVRGAIVGIRP